MKEEIVKIMYHHSTKMEVKNSILGQIDTEEYLWEGSFEDVANDIIKFLSSNGKTAGTQ